MKTTVILASLILVFSAGVASAELTDRQKSLYEFWNGKAKAHCWFQQGLWEERRDQLKKMLGNKPQPTTPEEIDLLATVFANKSALAECKGDYWLHFLIGADK